LMYIPSSNIFYIGHSLSSPSHLCSRDAWKIFGSRMHDNQSCYDWTRFTSSLQYWFQ
jgi:hypothetical protein